MFKKNSLRKHGSQSPSGSIRAVSGTSPVPSFNAVTNAIKTAGQKDLSDGLDSNLFRVDDLHHYGVSGAVVSFAYDPIQSLLALSTDEGKVYVYGQQRVEAVFELKTHLPITTLKFLRGVFVVAIDAKSTIFTLSLHTNKIISTYVAPALITAIDVDYSLEYLLLGLQTGIVCAFDIERTLFADFQLANLQKEIMPNVETSPVVAARWHPRDFGTILVAYNYVVVSYSIIEAKIIKTFVYDIPKGAPGGENARPEFDRFGVYKPKVRNALWHPNGLNIVVLHEDNSLVFWDAKTETLLQARTLFDTYVNVPANGPSFGSNRRVTPIIKLAWLCQNDPEYTSLLICGGDSEASEGVHNLIRMDFGAAPKYSITSYEKMGKYYAQPIEQRVFPVHSSSNIVDFFPLGESSPYFSGNHNPKIVAVLFENGELKFMNYPTGNLSYTAELFPTTVAWLNPKITCSLSFAVPKTMWLGMLSAKKRKLGALLKGGTPARHRYRKFDLKSVVVTGHENGYVRLWDSSAGELDSDSLFEIDISRILLDDSPEFGIKKVSFAPETAELSCALFNGDVMLFKYQKNRNFLPTVGDLNRRLSSMEIKKNDKLLNDISDRAPRDISEGFLPSSLLRARTGTVTAVCNSSVGFVAVGYEDGTIIVIDRRGPAVIYNDTLKDKGLAIKLVATSIEFANSPQCIEQGALFTMYVGTSIGRLLTYDIARLPNRRYEVKYSDSADANESEILTILPLMADSGRPNYATMGFTPSSETSNLVVTVSSSDIRVLKGSQKVARKNYGKGMVAVGGITGRTIGTNPTNSKVVFALILVLNSNQVKVLSIPALHDIKTLTLPYTLNRRYSSHSSILPMGDVFLRINDTEAALINIMGLRDTGNNAHDVRLFNKDLVIPSHPAVNTMHVMIGNVKVPTYEDFCMVMSGPHRTKATRAEAQLAFAVSPYNPANIKLLGNTATPSSAYYDEEVQMKRQLSYSKPKSPRTGKWFPGVNASMRKAYYNVSDQIDTAQETVDDYATKMKDELNAETTEARNGLLSALVKTKLGI
ncbi:unnamed protein product [Kuraishia capsulata CBS 1993]|uniref:Lethal giant larvae (Lgl)-like C-terminal domain-containing protein n=1 Tax=Kuraishia capsulata CBS 1993 TaxID=1382522 RepID=W6MQP3_9ASCO|nr:uncharacterized protein KUCA_T00004977001 [Kuraishia capsulata CBS 1993]CDK28991.1 unnamed protein product [Kuraishia capsulata CBS 1993]